MGKSQKQEFQLSFNRFRSNEVRLWLSVIAYNLGNLWRRLVKTGGRLAKHAPLLLAIAGGEPSDAAAVRSNVATDGGSHDPSGVEPPVVPMKKSTQRKTPKEEVFEESGSGSGDNGFRGLLDGRFGADDPLGEKIGRGWTEMGVYFQPPDGQKVNSGQAQSGAVRGALCRQGSCL